MNRILFLTIFVGICIIIIFIVSIKYPFNCSTSPNSIHETYYDQNPTKKYISVKDTPDYYLTTDFQSKRSQHMQRDFKDHNITGFLPVLGIGKEKSGPTGFTRIINHGLKYQNYAYSNLLENNDLIHHKHHCSSYEPEYGPMNLDLLHSGITTIITTAPQPSIPSPTLIINTLKSLEIVSLFKTSPIIIGFDGCTVVHKNLDPKCKTVYSCPIYEQYKENVKREATKVFPNVKFVELGTRGCLSSLLYSCIQHVQTQFVNIVQQDLPIVKYFDAENVLLAMENNTSMDLVRYSFGTNKSHEKYTHNMCGKTLPKLTIIRRGLKFTQCSQWSDNNHIAKVDHYRNLVWPNTNTHSFMEHQIACYPVDNGYKKIWYLGEPDDGDFIYHTDGRNTKIPTYISMTTIPERLEDRLVL